MGTILSRADKVRINYAQAEEILTTTYVGKWATFDYPGYKQVHGMVDSISIDSTKDEPVIVVLMNNTRYTCSIPNIRECLKILKQ